MNAETVSVGTELLLGQIVDTHAVTMAKVLAECGIACQRRTTVGDNLSRLVSVLKEALERADVVVTIGGLGPTQDDLTRDAVAAAMDDTLELVPEIAEGLRTFFASRGYDMPESNLRQAMKPTCSVLVENPFGTAPGLHATKNGKHIFCLPGPKGEFDPMAFGPVKVALGRLQPGQVIHSRVLRVIGIGESSLEEKLLDLMESEQPTVAPYAQTGEVHLRLTAKAASVSEANLILDPLENEIRARIGKAIYGLDQQNLEQTLIQDLKAKGETLAVAESMTGGSLSNQLSQSPGASEVFIGGIVAYSSEMKKEYLDVSDALMEEFGPVSHEIAHQMVAGILAKTGATHGLSITGNAGPEGDTDGKPVGLVFIAYGTKERIEVRQHQFRGTREEIRYRASQQAIQWLREEIA